MPLPIRETKIDRVGRLTYEAVSDIRKEMVTKDDLQAFATKLDLQDLREEMRGHFTELKTIMKQTITEQVAHTVAIAELRRRLARVEKRVGFTK